MKTLARVTMWLAAVTYIIQGLPVLHSELLKATDKIIATSLQRLRAIR